MTKNPVTDLFVLGAAVALLGGCATTASEDLYSDESYQENRGVAIVGSRIKRDTKASDRASPSQSYGREGMQSTGARTAGEFLGGRF